MSKLQIKGTFDTPEINFDSQNGKFEMSGRSLPANVHEYYSPIVKEIFSYFENPLQETEFTFRMDFINSSSSKIFQDIFNGLNELHNSGKTIKMSWFYKFGDDDMRELGEDLALECQFPIEYIVC